MSGNTESASIVSGFLQYLDNAGKQNLLPEIVALLQKQLGAKLPELIVESPIVLSEADKQSIISSVADLEHSGEIQFKVNPELIGGLKIVHGDRVLDMSVQSKLKKIYA